MIQTICKNCGNKKEFNEDKLGKKFKCPQCSNIVLIEKIDLDFPEKVNEVVTAKKQPSLSKTNKSRKVTPILFVIFILAIGVYFGIKKYLDNQEEIEHQKQVQEQMTQDSIAAANAAMQAAAEAAAADSAANVLAQMRMSLLNAATDSLKELKIKVITDYYRDLENKTLDAHKYFADEVEQYYTKYKVTPDEINADVENYYKEFLNGRMQLDQYSILADTISSKITYSGIFSCFRASKNKYQSCTVNCEVSFNDSIKISSLREAKIENLKFTDTLENKIN